VTALGDLGKGRSRRLGRSSQSSEKGGHVGESRRLGRRGVGEKKFTKRASGLRSRQVEQKGKSSRESPFPFPSKGPFIASQLRPPKKRKRKSTQKRRKGRTIELRFRNRCEILNPPKKKKKRKKKRSVLRVKKGPITKDFNFAARGKWPLIQIAEKKSVTTQQQLGDNPSKLC